VISPDEADQIIKAAECEFANPENWKRSRKGNLWRTWQGITVTVFRNRFGGYGWCAHDGREPQYSRGRFEDEEEAVMDAADELGVGFQ
jgi:hypothetical protein